MCLPHHCVFGVEKFRRPLSSHSRLVLTSGPGETDHRVDPRAKKKQQQHKIRTHTHTQNLIFVAKSLVAAALVLFLQPSNRTECQVTDLNIPNAHKFILKRITFIKHIKQQHKISQFHPIEFKTNSHARCNCPPAFSTEMISFCFRSRDLNPCL